LLRQDVIDRLSRALSWIRARATRRRIVYAGLIAFGLAAVGITIEAVSRAHLVPPAARAASAIYSRPTPWGTDSAVTPVVIGFVDPALQEQRIPVELAQVPRHLVDAVVAVEDQRFYRHAGLDVKRIAGAFVANVRAGGVAEGGSTITQQLAKNFFLSPSRNPIRKIREAALSAVLELRYSKDEILEAYLNEVYLGQDGGTAIHGVGAASRFYFGKSVDKLSLAESALLAGMIHAPNRVAPTRHADEALSRRNLVLDLMIGQKRVGSASAGTARAARVPSRSYPLDAIDARYFRDFVAASTVARVPDRGTAIYTTLDARLQQSAEKAVARGLSRLRLPGVEAAFVAIDPHTGEILAMVGGRDYAESQFNRAADAVRQPGSAFKPIVALAALESGANGSQPYTLASILEDEPLAVRVSRKAWDPRNYDGAYHGPVTLRHALEQSFNIPFARIGLTIGANRIVSMAQRLGITHDLERVPSVALGSSEVTLLELVRAYGVFAAGGRLAGTRWILNWRDHTGAIRQGPGPEIHEAADAAATFLVTSALQGVVRRGTARGLNAWRIKGDVAGKTGTSNNWRDAWFIAYSPSIVVGAWVGYDDGKSVRLSGGAAAVPIVAEFLANAPGATGGSFRVPAGIEQQLVYSIDPAYCGEMEFFLRGTAPPLYADSATRSVFSDSLSQPDTLSSPSPCAPERTSPSGTGAPVTRDRTR
jgi:penicillin-binding protein 1B